MKSDILKDILNKNRKPEDLKDDDFYYDIRQKGVDMRIGIDIASVAYKKQAERIVLISGGSDFVPAAKPARKKGIDFILDPMYAPVADDLFKHIDGLWSTCWKDKKK